MVKQIRWSRAPRAAARAATKLGGTFLSVAAQLVVAVTASSLCVSGLAAQDPGNAGTPPANNPVPNNPATGTPQAPVPASGPQYAKVLVDKVALRCWPSQVATPPVFEDVLVQGEVVMVGPVENGFRQILLPLGPVGYVSKRFTKTDDSGNVVSSGNDVSFRYRPRTSEAPVDYLADATALAVVGEDGDWWRVRAAGVKAWAPEAELQIVASDEAAVRGAAATANRFAGEVEARRAALEAQKQKAAQDAIDLAAVRVVEDAFEQQVKKPPAEQNFAPLSEALGKLEATLAAESAARPAVASLHKRIETQNWIAKATQVNLEKPVKATDVQPVLQPKDELERFQSIGWLRYESRFNMPGVYYLEKGGKRLHTVSCSTGRYDLALFLDREVGLKGPRRRPTAANGQDDSLDVERLEVLGAAPPR